MLWENETETLVSLYVFLLGCQNLVFHLHIRRFSFGHQNIWHWFSFLLALLNRRIDLMSFWVSYFHVGL